MFKFKVTLDGKIASANKVYVIGKGRVFLAPEVKQYRKDMAPIVRAAYEDAPAYEGGLLIVKADIHMDFFTKGGAIKRIDVDNFCKNILDTIFPVIELDDSLIFELRLRKVQYDGNPKATITITEAPKTGKQSRKRL